MSAPRGEISNIVYGSIAIGKSGRCKEKASDTWRMIPGYGGRYRVSDLGRIQACTCKTGKCDKWRDLVPAMKTSLKGADFMKIRLTDENGIRREHKVSRLVMETFVGKKPGMCIVHLNGDKKNNALYNLKYIERSELGKQTGAKSRRMPVLKINEAGEILDVYSSAREAGRQNFMSYQTVMDRCSGKTKHPFKWGDYTFIWDEDYDYDRQVSAENEDT